MGTSNFWPNDAGVPLIANIGCDDDDAIVGKCPKCGASIPKWKWEQESENGEYTCEDCGEKSPISEIEKDAVVDYDEMSFTNQTMFDDDEKTVADLLEKYDVKQNIFKIEIKSGYYEGWQLHITLEQEDPEDYVYNNGNISENDKEFWDEDDNFIADKYKEACAKEYKAAYDKELDGVLAVEKALVTDYGWTALGVSAHFSNGETWYSKIHPFEKDEPSENTLRESSSSFDSWNKRNVFDGRHLSDFVEKGDIKRLFRNRVNGVEYSRIKFNRMDDREQREYTDRLNEEKYEYGFSDEEKNPDSNTSSSYKIPKTGFDYIKEKLPELPIEENDYYHKFSYN